tara:strand:- start:206 stop:397 length:192 start_codon:yes stop_codon:yes gene_type:complete
MDQQSTVPATSSLVSARTFWDMKVQRVIQKLEYGQINEAQAKHDLALLGYDEEVLEDIFEEDE